MQLSFIDEQLKELQEHITRFDEKIIELGATIASLDDIEKITVGSDILIPLHQGIFARAKITQKDKFLVNVGASVVVEKTLIEAKDMLKSQFQELNITKEKAVTEIKRLLSQGQEIQKEAQKITG